jgi:hypothetical protein
MPEAKRSAADGARPLKQQEVCGYIHDLLKSLEAIAAQNKLPVLAHLIGMAKKEADDCR